MGAHLVDGEFQSDKYPTTPRGKVPLSVRDVLAQDLLWEYAQRRRTLDAEFSADLETALRAAGFVPPNREPIPCPDAEHRWRPEDQAMSPEMFRSVNPTCVGCGWSLGELEVRMGTPRYPR